MKKTENDRLELCFTKLINVCKNRQFDNIANDILELVAPKYLSIGQVQKIINVNDDALGKKVNNLVIEPKVDAKKKAFSTKRKLPAFLEQFKFGGDCKMCSTPIKIGDTGFIFGNDIFHTFCGIQRFGDAATANKFYIKWLNPNRSVNYDHDYMNKKYFPGESEPQNAEED